MTQDKHSPLPWREENGHIVAYPEWLTTNILSKMSLPEKQEEENRAFILRAVNNHYQLVEALEVMTDRLQLFLDTHGEFGDRYSTQADIDDARQALSNAKGGSNE